LALYPALDVTDADGDLVLAVADDYAPTAVEEHDGFLTLFFSDNAARDRARDALAAALPAARLSARDVDDEDWARRSQAALGPVTVGRVTITPSSKFIVPNYAIRVVIPPSMAFGTGHHATTRLCLAALQMLNLQGTLALDVGTGSGILAIAARLLGAEGAVGIDNDADAVDCARANLALNPGAADVRFELADLLGRREARDEAGGQARGFPLSRPPDVVTANLTGALLCRAAQTLMATFAPGGALIVGGLLAEERDEVVAAFDGIDLVWEMEEDGWVGLGFARL
jgi:ribosomal protein L11 methyltransferase